MKTLMLIGAYTVMKKVVVPVVKAITEGICEGIRDYEKERYIYELNKKRENPLKG